MTGFEPSIYGFYHVATLGNWRAVFREQLQLLTESGLAAASRQIGLGVVSWRPWWPRWSLRQSRLPATMSRLFHRSVREMEFPTLVALHKHCQQHPDSVVWYIHSKGVSRSWDPKAQDWRHLMQYFVLEQWQRCRDSLATADVCGVNWRLEPKPHFSGNFWWARADYVRRLEVPRMITDRLDAEFWLGSGDPRVACLHESGVRHFHEPYPPERYRRELQATKS